MATENQFTAVNPHDTTRNICFILDTLGENCCKNSLSCTKYYVE